MTPHDLARALVTERFTPSTRTHDDDNPQDTPQACATRRARLLEAIRDEGRNDQ